MKLDREIRKSEDNHKTPPTEKIGDIFVSVCYAIDIGMGDMEYIKELAGRYNISKSNVA